MDDLYEAQKDANLIPYRHVNREFKGVNAPTHLALDGSVGLVRQRLIGEIPQIRLPPAPDGHHWFRGPAGTYNTKRNPGYNGPRKEYDAEEGRFYASGRQQTTPGTNRFKAEFAEDAAYDWMIDKGHSPLPRFRRPRYGEHGVDGLFINANDPPPYVVVEAKYHKSTFGSIQGPDGIRYKQMSDEWIVAKLEDQLTDDMFLDVISNGYEKITLRYRPDLERVVKEEVTW